MSNFPALDGQPVTERHARICREQGHATHTVNGVVAVHCPRCGEPRTEAPHAGGILAEYVRPGDQWLDRSGEVISTVTEVAPYSGQRHDDGIVIRSAYGADGTGTGTRTYDRGEIVPVTRPAAEPTDLVDDELNEEIDEDTEAYWAEVGARSDAEQSAADLLMQRRRTDLVLQGSAKLTKDEREAIVASVRAEALREVRDMPTEAPRVTGPIGDSGRARTEEESDAHTEWLSSVLAKLTVAERAALREAYRAEALREVLSALEAAPLPLPGGASRRNTRDADLRVVRELLGES